jgi:hypothetical protein
MEDIKPVIPRPIFTNDDGRPLKIWLDPHLASHDDLAVSLQAGGARLSSVHEFSDTRYLILHPSSTGIFDRYCHPSWLRRKKGSKEIDNIVESRRKVLLTAEWIEKSIVAGRALLLSEDWGGCRKGG